ncbi:MAG: hypothetical protein LBK61_10570 [Spirochaetaceae bacterium]|nr:hypothetical protein [Spirochaetaceae bacterium]
MKKLCLIVFLFSASLGFVRAQDNKMFRQSDESAPERGVVEVNAGGGAWYSQEILPPSIPLDLRAAIKK